MALDRLFPMLEAKDRGLYSGAQPAALHRLNNLASGTPITIHKSKHGIYLPILYLRFCYLKNFWTARSASGLCGPISHLSCPICEFSPICFIVRHQNSNYGWYAIRSRSVARTRYAELRTRSRDSKGIAIGQALRHLCMDRIMVGSVALESQNRSRMPAGKNWSAESALGVQRLPHKEKGGRTVSHKFVGYKNIYYTDI